MERPPVATKTERVFLYALYLVLIALSSAASVSLAYSGDAGGAFGCLAACAAVIIVSSTNHFPDDEDD